jgi:hypothetical protein
MRVLLIDPNEAAAAVDPAREALTLAGHEVVQCSDPSGDHLCRGMPDGPGCPVDSGAVDVAVSVSAATRSPLGTDGVRCAVRHFVPLVTTGEDIGDSDPFAGAIAVIHAADAAELSAAVTLAAARPLVRHGQLASSELRAVLANHGIDPDDADVVVHRAGGALRAEMRPGVVVTGTVAQAAAVRVAAALRAYDASATGVGVVLAGG